MQNSFYFDEIHCNCNYFDTFKRHHLHNGNLVTIETKVLVVLYSQVFSHQVHTFEK